VIDTYKDVPTKKCKQCPVGTVAKCQAKICKICPAGKYADHLTGKCSKCEHGTRNKAMQDSCLKCDKYGEWSGVGYKECCVCGVGEHDDNLKRCLPSLF
jgi:hypothetical protein